MLLTDDTVCQNSILHKIIKGNSRGVRILGQFWRSQIFFGCLISNLVMLRILKEKLLGYGEGKITVMVACHSASACAHMAARS